MFPPLLKKERGIKGERLINNPRISGCYGEFQSAKLIIRAYYEKVYQDYIRGYPGCGDDPAAQMPGAVYILSHLSHYAPELYPGVAGSITG